MTQLKALERVCDKRHARLMENGNTENNAASIVANYLAHWIERNKYVPCKVHYASALHEAYGIIL